MAEISRLEAFIARRAWDIFSLHGKDFCEAVERERNQRVLLTLFSIFVEYHGVGALEYSQQAIFVRLRLRYLQIGLSYPAGGGPDSTVCAFYKGESSHAS